MIQEAQLVKTVRLALLALQLDCSDAIHACQAPIKTTLDSLHVMRVLQARSRY